MTRGLREGLCWLCTVTCSFEWGMDTHACTLLCDLGPICAILWLLWLGHLLGFLRALSITAPYGQPVAVAVWSGRSLSCTARIIDAYGCPHVTGRWPVHARILFFSVYGAYHYTYISSADWLLLCFIHALSVPFYSTMPFRLELFNCILQLYSVSCCISLSGVISWYILHLSIRRCMCFYVLSITLDRLVLCTLSVLRLCWNFFWAAMHRLASSR